MATKEEIDDIRATIERGWYAGNIGDARTLLSALDDANKRIAKLEADLDRAAPRQKSIGTVYLTPGETIEKLEAKLAKVREWAERASRINAGSDYERDDRDMEREQCGDEVLAILDGKDTP